MANSDVDGGAAPDLPAGGRRLSERSSGCGVGAAGAANPARAAWRATAQDRHAGGDQRYSLFVAYGLPMAICRATAFRHPRRSTTSFACSSVMASGRRSGPRLHLALPHGPRGQPLSGGSRQSVDQIGRKRAVTPDKWVTLAGEQVKGRKIHALVDSEGLPMRVVVPLTAIPDRDGAGLVLDKSALGSTDLG